jgi:uncharacterized protein YyaL (SSP411 family)
MTHQFANRLVGETSPYLLQHAHNPVDWFPWTQEALELARAQDRPILLSVGYSACHWCHVMERESFENEETARIMNEHFVNIKVDREERPDLDAIYMNFVQMTTGQGGWPLTVFLTPDLLPFYGGTYFPPENAHGRPGFKTVLLSVLRFYRERRSEIESSRTVITQHLEQAGTLLPSGSALNERLLDDSAEGICRQFDSRHGGFGPAPKFPGSMILSFLLRHYHRTRDNAALKAATTTLDKMAKGGIYDQLGGGFHRYSVDERWLVPHFEKMLYDNALLARSYLEAYQVTKNEHYREVVEETLDYVRRDLTDPSGGFYSSEDADSEGVEGKFYVWEPEEIDSVLGPEEGRLFRDYYDVSKPGNWGGMSILNHRRELGPLAEEYGHDQGLIKARLKASREKLLKKRQDRVRPGLDDKVVASWNGLMLTAFAEAALVLDDDTYLKTALRSAGFLTSQMLSEGCLYRTWKQGNARLNGYVDDYAHVVEGLLAVFQLTGDILWLERAAELMDAQIELFYDSRNGDFFFTASNHEALLVRHKELLDSATPSGNSTSAMNLLVLAELTGRAQYKEMAERLVLKVSPSCSRLPTAAGNWLKAAGIYLGEFQEIVLLGPSEGRKAFLDRIRDRFLPHAVLVQSDRPQAGELALLPLLAGKAPLGEKATAFVCRNFTCREPTTDPARFQELVS